MPEVGERRLFFSYQPTYHRAMNFVSHAQLLVDLEDWEQKLPAFDAVCGIPRSGLLPSAYLALRRNVPHLSLEDLKEDPLRAFARAPLRRINSAAGKPRGTRILVVDDSTSDPGNTILQVREQLSHVRGFDISYGAVYRESDKTAADYTYRRIPKPRMFQWNWFRHGYLGRCILDIDGVVCRDWLEREEQNDDPVYLQHLTAVAPLWVPELPVLGLATSRLERYRPQTEAWLARHGVRYKYLYMHSAPTPEARRLRGDHASHKAEVYKKHADALLFVESSRTQAEQIRAISKRPVLCIETMKMY